MGTHPTVNAIGLAQATYGKMLQYLWWATGYNVVAIRLAAGVLRAAGILLSPAVGAILVSPRSVIVAINARFLALESGCEPIPSGYKSS